MLPLLLLLLNLLQRQLLLLPQLRLAQRGGVDLQGHLSKFNPDAAEQGIFAQDWELRYFVLSGEGLWVLAEGHPQLVRRAPFCLFD